MLIYYIGDIRAHIVPSLPPLLIDHRIILQMSEEDTPSLSNSAPNNNNQPTASVDDRPRPNEPIAVSTSNDSNDSSANNADDAVAGAGNEEDDFDSRNVCYISQAPPMVPVTFDIPGCTSSQVFERAYLLRFIFTISSPHGNWRFVKHPTCQASISRAHAMLYVRDVSSERRTIIHEERRRLGLLMEEPEVLSEDERRMNITLSRVLDPK